MAIPNTTSWSTLAHMVAGERGAFHEAQHDARYRAQRWDGVLLLCHTETWVENIWVFRWLGWVIFWFILMSFLKLIAFGGTKKLGRNMLLVKWHIFVWWMWRFVKSNNCSCFVSFGLFFFLFQIYWKRKKTTTSPQTTWSKTYRISPKLLFGTCPKPKNLRWFFTFLVEHCAGLRPCRNLLVFQFSRFWRLNKKHVFQVQNLVKSWLCKPLKPKTAVFFPNSKIAFEVWTVIVKVICCWWGIFWFLMFVNPVGQPDSFWLLLWGGLVLWSPIGSLKMNSGLGFL